MRATKVLNVFAILVAVGMLAAAVPAMDTPDGEFDRTLSVSGAVDLDIENRSGSITVITGASNTVEIHAEIKRNRNWNGRRASEADVQAVIDNPPIVQEGNSIRIEKIDNDIKLSISYKITVPTDTTVKAGTGSGSIKVSGVSGSVTSGSGSGSIRVEDVGGDARLRTGSGSIKAENVGGNFHGSTGSGSIHASLAGASEVEVSTGSGSIKVTGINGSLRAKTGSGSVRLTGAPEGDWSVTTGSGGITVDFPEGSSFDLKASASSGSVTTDFPITIQGKISRRKLEGTVGDGGHSVRLSSSSGSIRIGNNADAAI